MEQAAPISECPSGGAASRRAQHRQLAESAGCRNWRSSHPWIGNRAWPTRRRRRRRYGSG